MSLLFLGIAGGLGCVCRHLAGELLMHRYPHFPLGTLSVNLLGSLLMGLVVGMLFNRNLLNSETRLVLCVGFLGGFTTYSSFALDALGLLEKGRELAASVYLSVSLVGGIALCGIGLFLGKRL